MGNSKNFLAVSSAVAIGIVSGLYSFGPAFEEEAQKKKDLALLKTRSQEPTGAGTQASFKEAQKASQEAVTTAALAAKSAEEAVKNKFLEASVAEEKALEKGIQNEQKKD